jgi:hypothetical protein
MSDSEKVVKLIQLLTIISNEILAKMLPIMQILVDDDNDFVDEIVYSTDMKDKKFVNTWLQEFSMAFISGAENVKKEASSFTKSYEQGSDVLDKNIKQYPFLADVWFGDIYDGKEELSAFETLLEELKTELSEADEDFIIKKAITHFSQ